MLCSLLTRCQLLNKKGYTNLLVNFTRTYQSMQLIFLKFFEIKNALLFDGNHNPLLQGNLQKFAGLFVADPQSYGDLFSGLQPIQLLQ